MLLDFFKKVIEPQVAGKGKFKKIILSADNCGGQNKNRTLMAFLKLLADTAWETVRRRNCRTILHRQVC